MGTLFSRPKPPPPPKPVAYKNYITGFEQVPVTQPDGSVVYVTKELPLSAEQQARKNKLEAISKSALDEIEKLSSTDYTFSDNTQKLINNWENEKEEDLTSSFRQRERKEEDVLASRGLSDSTAANTLRRQRKQDQYDAETQIDREKLSLKEDIKASNLQNQLNLYQLAKNQENYEFATKQKEASNSLAQLNAINKTNISSINDYYRQKLSSFQGRDGFVQGLTSSLTSGGLKYAASR